MKIYLASSWRNTCYKEVLARLRWSGFEVYDFKDPAGAFKWSEIDPNWQSWTFLQYLTALDHPEASRGYLRDMRGLGDSDVLVLLLPCGKSAHLEAGYAVGRGKPVYILIPEFKEPDLMYKMVDGIFDNVDDMITILRTKERGIPCLDDQ